MSHRIPKAVSISDKLRTSGPDLTIPASTSPPLSPSSAPPGTTDALTSLLRRAGRAPPICPRQNGHLRRISERACRIVSKQRWQIRWPHGSIIVSLVSDQHTAHCGSSGWSHATTTSFVDAPRKSTRSLAVASTSPPVSASTSSMCWGERSAMPGPNRRQCRSSIRQSTSSTAAVTFPPPRLRAPRRRACEAARILCASRWLTYPARTHELQAQSGMAALHCSAGSSAAAAAAPPLDAFLAISTLWPAIAPSLQPPSYAPLTSIQPFHRRFAEPSPSRDQSIRQQHKPGKSRQVLLARAELCGRQHTHGGAALRPVVLTTEGCLYHVR
mmetsp:Transcript_13632/g.35037  ORF Transcript_13632/g.35037 Transcript_13632/m.35037 type:complete len:328 (+) Transcript_13632:409-1392(+)